MNQLVAKARKIRHVALPKQTASKMPRQQADTAHLSELQRKETVS